MRQTILPAVVLLAGCGKLAERSTHDGVLDPSATMGAIATMFDDAPLPRPFVTDEALASGYQDNWFGGLKRGRGNLVADFDGDGDYDVFSGNPGNESYLLRNVTPPGGELAFEPWQVLSTHEMFYGGVVADFDGDGDPDLYIAAGANDDPERDRLFRNDFGQGAPDDAPFVDQSDIMALGSAKLQGGAHENGTMGARAFDVDLDGDLDVWADNYAHDSWIASGHGVGLNQLYFNDGDGFLRDHAEAVGLDILRGSRHSSILDFDLDGDPDIFENNYHGGSVLWRNTLVETGTVHFVNDTSVQSRNVSLAEPIENQAMCSIATDLNNDGWEDLLVLNRGLEYSETNRHFIFMNLHGEGFAEVGQYSDLNATFGTNGATLGCGNMDIGWGVMGCQVGDANLDGFPDVFLGNGAGSAGDVNQLLVSRERERVEIPGVGSVIVPMFDDWSAHIDIPPGAPSGSAPHPYPLRTHGSSFVDFDGDGVPELSVHNGGPANAEFVEPNRLFKFHHLDPRFLRVRLVGDGTLVNRDGIGSRVKITVERDRDGATWDLYQTRHSATGFGAQNEPELTFGLADADRITAVEVLWTDGVVTEVPAPEGVRAWLTVNR